MRVAVAVGDAGAVDDHGIVEQGAVALRNGFQLLHPGRELPHMIVIDLRDFLDHGRIVAVMRQRVMPIGKTDFAVSAVAAFAHRQERGHARKIRLEGDGHHVGHQLEVLAEFRGDAEGLSIGDRFGRHAFRALNAALQLANRREVFVELPLVGRSDTRPQPLGIFGDEVEHAAAENCGGFGLPALKSASSPKSRSNSDAGIENRRQRLVFVLPRQIIGVGAGVTRVAVPGLLRVFDTKLRARGSGSGRQSVGRSPDRRRCPS